MSRLRSYLAKVDLSDIVRDHDATLYDNSSASAAWRDRALFYGAPVVLGAGVAFSGIFAIYDVGGLLTAVAIVAGFLFALLIVVLESAIGISARAEDQTGATEGVRRRTWFLGEIKANIAYSVVVAIALTSLLAGIQLSAKPSDPGDASPLPPILTAIVIALLAHLMLTLLMVVKRTYRLIELELRRAETSSPPTKSTP